MRKLEPSQLKEGMITAEPIRTPLGQELAPAGTIVTRQLINRMKLYRTEYAIILGEDSVSPVEPEQIAPEEASEPETTSAPSPAPAPDPNPVKTRAEASQTHIQKVGASDEFRSFQISYVQTMALMKISFSKAIEEHQPIDTSQLLASISNLLHSRNTIVELFDMIYNMRTTSDSVYAHCLNVALISRMIGRWLRCDPHDLDVLTLAGLLHDIGKLLIPEEILNKPGSLTDEEFAKIKEHPKRGYEIVKNQPNLDPRIKKTVLMHHERCDGSGYPTGLTEDFIDNFAMVVAIADVYDAMTAARSYRSPLCPFQVISKFETEGFQKYYTKYILTFLSHIASAYQNNRVLLSDGRSCNIVMLNQHALSRPIVQFDDNSCLDLSSSDKSLYIQAVL